MTRVAPLRKDEIDDPAITDAMAKQESQLGLVPESLLTMAHRPAIAAAWATLAGAVTGDGTVDRGLKQLVAYVASATHGCRYCQAHTAHRAEQFGVALEKLQSAFTFDTTDLFSEAEQDALSLARDAAMVPSAVTDEHFARLRRWFSDEQIVEIVAVIAMFGWLNRWNDTMATTIEDHPLQFATENLAPRAGWDAGVHGPARDRGQAHQQT